MSVLAARVAARHVQAEGRFSVGDDVLFGKYKNKRGRIVRFFEDDRGVPSVEIEPVPKGRKQNKTMGLYKIWRADMRKEACIVFSKKCDGDVILGKVRDRMYDPEICIYHMEVGGTEMCVMFDRITGFCEGVNEHGIGIVNSTLMVLQDEREGVADGDNEPERSPDGVKIIKALTYDNVGDVLQSLILHKPKRFKRGLKGHTLVSDGDKVYALENTRIHAPKTMKLDADRVHTRTNHGIYYPGAGYTKGPDYISSIVRRWEAQKQLEKAQHAEDLMPALTQAIEKVPSAFSPARFTDKMRTTSQFAVDPKNRRVRLYLVPEHSEFKGVRNLLPGGRKPKIKAQIFKYPSEKKLREPAITVPEEMSVDSARRERADPAGMSERVASRYKSKKKVKTKDGDEMTVYEYSDRQVADRDRKKAERIEKLRKSMKKLQAKVRKDVKSKDEKTRDLALAVGLMDETFERVGNDGSAKEGHFGVTTWRAKHVKFGKGSVTITYVGKSGVDQKKKVTNARIVSALRKACEDKGKDDCVLSVTASEVNTYLKPFGISAKDIRGFHANEQMKAELKKVRKGKLPADPKEREKRLKEEFDRALEAAAEHVGHEASTLKSQYLVPGLEDDYKRDGTINDSHTKKGAEQPHGLRTAAEQGTATERRILANAVHAPVLVARDRSWWLREAPSLYRIARAHERPRPDVDGLRFPPEMFAVLWHEDQDGHRLDWDADGDGIPDSAEPRDGARYQLSQFPNVLHESILRLNDDGTSTEIMRGDRGFPEDLVTEMVRSGDWDVGDAIMAAAQACERCLNTLTFRYQPEDGYEFGSSMYWQAGTRCKMCDHVDNAPEDEHRLVTATKSDAEVEEEKVQKMLRKEPKKKPPRYDLRDNRTLDEEDEEDLGGGDGGDRDLSMKWNKVARRVAFQWLAVPRGISGARVALWHRAKGEKDSEFRKSIEGRKFRHPETNNEVSFDSLPPEEQTRIYEKWRQSQGPAQEDEKDDKKKEPEERSQEEIGKDLEEARDKADELKDEAKGLKAKVREHEKNIEKLKDSLGREAPKPGEKREKVQGKIDEVKQRMEADEARKEELGGEIDGLGEKAQQLAREIDERKANIERLEQQAGAPRPDPKAKREKLESQLEETRQQIEEGKSESEQLDAELDDLEEQLDETEISSRETKKLVGDLLKCTRNLNPDHPTVQKAKEKAREGRREFRQLQRQIAEQKKEISDRKKRIDQIAQDEKKGSDLIEKLEAALEEPDEEAPISPDEAREKIKEERTALREAEQQQEDLGDELKAKKTEHKKLRREEKQNEALMEKLEAALDEPDEAPPPSDDEVQQKIKEETAKMRQAEDAFDEKMGDLKAQQKVVNDLKAERADPSGAKRKEKAEKERKRKERVQAAVQKTQETLQTTLGKGSDLPKDLRVQVEAMLDALSDEQVEEFSTGFADRLGKHTKLDPTSDDAVTIANEAAAFGEITGLDDPVEIANRLADLAYGRNVVANPLIVGGKPVGQTEINDDTAYGERALDGFRQFQRLHPALRRRAVETLQQNLRGLDEDTHRAKELNAILTGMDVAQIADTGEALPGRPQPSKGNAAIFKKMVENGEAERLFIPAKDFFAEEGRKALADAMREMTPEEVANLATSGDKGHPYSDIHDLIHDDQTPDAMKAMMQDFLAQDILNDAWGDRAIRDTMEAAGIEDADDPDVRDGVAQEAKKREAPNREKAMEARERVEQARAKGEEPDPEDVTAMEAYFDKEKGGGGLMGNMRALMDTLKDKFKRVVVSPATAMINHVLNTGDAEAMSQETLPHPDEGAKEPRPKEEREKARLTRRELLTGPRRQQAPEGEAPEGEAPEGEAPEEAGAPRGEEGDAREPVQKFTEELEGYRVGDEAPEFDGGSDEWVAEHEVTTPGGSYVLGTPHMGESDEGDKWIQEKLVASAVDAAKKAIEAGKKVVFLGEGGPPDEMEGSEQKTVADALREVGDVEMGTWDDEPTYIDDDAPGQPGKSVIDREAPAAKALIERFDDPGLVEAALASAMWDQMDEDENPYVLSDEAKEALRSRGIDPEDKEALGKMWEDDDLSTVAEAYARIRDENIAKKIREIEEAGGVAIVTPGAQHAYQLKGALSGGKGPAAPEEGGEREERKPGDVWRTKGGKWGAKNMDGKFDMFDDREKAEAFAKGKKREKMRVEPLPRPGRKAAEDLVAEAWLAKRGAGMLGDRWLAHVRSIHPDDPNRPIVVVEAA